MRAMYARYLQRYLLRGKYPMLTSVCRKHLLVERTGKCQTTIAEVREKLQQLVGSSKLWRKEDTLSLGVTGESQQDLPRRRMTDSYQEACIPLGRNTELRDKYVNFYNTVRFGRITEDLDTMAVWISYVHNLGPDPKKQCPYIIVTALVDSINLNTVAIHPDRDILLRGHVTWVGQTSVEVSMYVDQQTDGDWQELLDAKFLMVARNPLGNSKAYVSPLEVVTEEERNLYTKGEENKARRQEEKELSLLRTPPSEDERQIIHDLFLCTLDNRAVTFKHPVKPAGAVWMEDTLLKNVHVCFPEERNLYNKIFGGFLMRQAFEIGWVNACLYSQSRPISIRVDDIMFRKPVQVGSLLFLSSQIVYTKASYMEIRVHAEVVDPKTRKHETTNIFYYTFKSNQGHVSVVMPKSYAEYMMFIDGKRHFEAEGKHQMFEE